MDEEFKELSEQDFEFSPIPRSKDKVFYQRNYLYENGEIPEFINKKDERQMRTDKQVERLEKQYQHNMEFLAEEERKSGK